ncbi:MAG: hypothetical protein CALGDGBN_02659 [Pseudomonadales bacterium]|nr:hypothetical protein [Pseudomonadales bacterium]
MRRIIETFRHRSELLTGCLLWLMLAVCAWLYWPGLDGPPLLDDGVNLRVIYSIDERPEYLADVVFGNKSGPLGRPISMLTFGLEQLYGEAGVRGLKRTNLLLHLLNGCLVMWFACLMLPLLLRKSAATYWAAVVCGMWLLTPLFVSTTLYVVQRMTQIAFLFALLGLVTYIKGRLILERGNLSGLVLIVLSLLFGGAAALSKENGMMVFPLIVLTEMTCWRMTVRCSSRNTTVVRLLFGIAVASAVVGGLAHLSSGGSSVLGGYANRDFNMTERVLTQSRVLFDYLFLLLFPLREGLGLYHDDYVISRSLLNPPATLGAVVFWLAVVFYTMVSIIKDNSAIAYGVAFFLVAHSMESSVFALEIYFEHRNYLPAAGLYLSVGVALAQGWERFPLTRSAMSWAIAAWFGAAVTFTGIQSAIWSREIILSRDALNSHPASVRANAAIATNFARMGAVEQALRYMDRSAELRDPLHLRNTIRKLALYCMANRPIDPHLLAELSDRMNEPALGDAGVSESLQNFVERANRSQCERIDLRPVLAVFEHKLLGVSPFQAVPRVYALLAILEHYTKNRSNTYAYLDRWIRREPNSVEAWLIRLTVTTMYGDKDMRVQSLTALDRLARRGEVTREQLDDIQLFRTVTED